MATPEDWNSDYFSGTVSFRNTDAHGWMHNTEYSEVAEDARMGWLKKRGVSQKELQNRDLIIALVDIKQQFFKGAQIEDFIAVTTKLVKVGNSSMTFEHEIFVENPITREWALATRMTLVLVCATQKKGMEPKSCPIPDDVREKLLPHLEEPSQAIQAAPPKAKAAVPFDIGTQVWL